MIAVLLFLIAGAEVLACDVSDACVPAASASAGCDTPSGDNCLCCCHHVIPMRTFDLAPNNFIDREPFREPPSDLSFVPLPIDHPPQL